MLENFKFRGNDGLDKPKGMNSKADKLSGNASQNWCLLRLLPLIIGHLITNFDDEVWNLYLFLKNIVEIITASKISTEMIVFLKVSIEDYLDKRSNLFSTCLKPKHHYLMHYPELILQFGPLIKLWTLRFESKHGYFKKYSRNTQNFKNLCSTLANCHQNLQCYLGAGNLFKPEINIVNGIEFNIQIYSEDINLILAGYNLNSNNTIITYACEVKGTLYKQNFFVPLSRNDTGIVFGEIIFILIKNNSLVYFFIKNWQAKFFNHLGLHALTKCEVEIKQCVKFDDLLDFYPLTPYKINDELYISLHHGFP